MNIKNISEKCKKIEDILKKKKRRREYVTLVGHII